MLRFDLNEPATIQALSSQYFEGKKPNCLEFSELCPGYFVVGNYILHKSQPEDAQKTSTEENSKLKNEVNVKIKLEDTTEMDLLGLQVTDAHIGDAEEVEQSGSNNNEESEIPKQEQIITGYLSWCRLKTEGFDGNRVEVEIVDSFPEESGGIYDLHFNRFDKSLLVLTRTTGAIEFYRIQGYMYSGPPQGEGVVFPRPPSGVMQNIREATPEYGSNSDSDRNNQWPYLMYHGRFTIADRGTTIIAIDWHKRFNNVFSVSLSNGKTFVCAYYPDPREPLDVVVFTISGCSTNKHEAWNTDTETWCVAWGHTWSVPRTANGPHISPTMTHLVSGGDDNKLRCASVWLDGEGGQSFGQTAKFEVSENGVTAVVHHRGLLRETMYEDHFLVGSYDNKVRLISVQSPHASRPPWVPPTKFEVLAETPDLGGTIHKFVVMRKHLSTLQNRRVHQNIVLVSCVKAGVRILLVSSMGERSWIQVVAKFEGHDHNMSNYASGSLPRELIVDEDMKRVLENEKEDLCVSTTLEDGLMCVWKSFPFTTTPVDLDIETET